MHAQLLSEKHIGDLIKFEDLSNFINCHTYTQTNIYKMMNSLYYTYRAVY